MSVSIQCEKEFTITVKAKDKLKAYYRAENLVGGILSDDVDGHDFNFSPHGNNLPSIIPGKIGNAFEYLAFDPGVGYEGDTVIVGDPIFDVADKSWLLRFWLNHGPMVFEAEQLIWNNENQISLGITNNGQIHVFTEPDGSNDIFSAVLSPGVWYRVIAFGDVLHGILGLKIDNNPTQTSFYTGSASFLYNFVSMGFDRLNDYNLALDEIGFWKDYIWTQADFDKDWNNGNGITFPEAQQIG